VRSVGAISDGVVVGSAFVRVIEENAALPDLPAKMEALARKLAGGLLSKSK
jgi:tryptophan synthase alpha subunit